MAAEEKTFKAVATNKKAYHSFFLTDKWEAGIALSGAEVKSLRAAQVSFTDSFARVDGGEIRLYNLHINPYREASYLNEPPDRPRTLLLHKREIRKIAALVTAKGMTLLPTRIYFNARGFVKVELALGRGKKLYDKRETIKQRELDRGLKRAIANRRR